MKKIYLLSMLLAFGLNLMAKPVSIEKAMQLGGMFMVANNRAASAQLKLVYTEIAETGTNIFYVFGCQPKGFVIIAADDRMKPVLGYSTESNFFEVVPDGMRTFFDNYKAGFEQMVVNDDPQSEQALADWTSLEKTGRLQDKGIKSIVGPLLSSIWNQTDLYNNMAPEDASSVYSGHCKSGCVANAMCQVMRYWEWPRHGTGMHSYYAYSYYGNYGEQTANYSEATYQFELMPDFLDFASPQYEVDATALLEYHAGVGVEMGYGPNASGAYSDDVPAALTGFFRYSSDLELRDMDWYDMDTWKNMLRENLDEGKPLYYASSGPDGGHAYVLDGYDELDYFHLNWGWGGFDNGYYAIDGFYLTFYSFPWYHNAIFDIHPNSEYYLAPKGISELEATSNTNDLIQLSFSPIFENRNGELLDAIDAIYIMRDGVLIDSMLNVTEPNISYSDAVEKAGTYYYTVYAANEYGMSKVMRDTVMIGSTCDLRFELSDTGLDGWDLSSIAVLDEDGKIVKRVGLWEGGSASLIEQIPNNQNVVFFWTYDNTCYSHGSLVEVSYEIYDWDGQLIAASNGYPEVGVIAEYEINCENEETAVDELAHQVSLYPNPASTSFKVEGKVKELSVYDMLGQRIYQGTTNEVDVTTWSEGVYFVRMVDDNDAVSAAKFLKR